MKVLIEGWEEHIIKIYKVVTLNKEGEIKTTHSIHQEEKEMTDSGIIKTTSFEDLPENHWAKLL